MARHHQFTHVPINAPTSAQRMLATAAFAALCLMLILFWVSYLILKRKY